MTARPGRIRIPHRRWLGSAVTAVAVMVLSACTSGDPVVLTQTVTPPAAAPAAAGEVTVPDSSPTVPVGTTAAAAGAGSATGTVRVVASPQFGSVDVAPAAPVTVTVFNATITDLAAVSSLDGTVLAGTTAPDGRSWKLDGRMTYGATYAFTGTAVSAGGASTPIEGTLSTVDPAETTRASFQLSPGGTYGVATPIILTFAGQVTDKAAAQKALTVTTDKGEIAGSWGWLQDEDIQGNGVLQSRVHFRTESYWPGNTQVTVTAALNGVDLGGGAWGREDLDLTFGIGRAQVVKADVNSFRLLVQVDGVTTKDYPVSYGRNTDDPELETRSGVHVVQEKFDSFEMCNPKYGYCGFIANWAVRISNNGEFIHENAAVVASLGKENVSHGCVNMSPSDAKDFYDNALYGDPVKVSGTSTQLSPADGDIFDWTYDFAEWRSFSAL